MDFNKVYEALKEVLEPEFYCTYENVLVGDGDCEMYSGFQAKTHKEAFDEYWHFYTTPIHKIEFNRVRHTLAHGIESEYSILRDEILLNENHLPSNEWCEDDLRVRIQTNIRTVRKALGLDYLRCTTPQQAFDALCVLERALVNVIWYRK